MGEPRKGFAMLLKRAQVEFDGRVSIQKFPLKDTHANDVPVIAAEFAADQMQPLWDRIDELEAEKEVLRTRLDDSCTVIKRVLEDLGRESR